VQPKSLEAAHWFCGTGEDRRLQGRSERPLTDADFAAQEIFIRKLIECFPGYGIVAEEHGFMRNMHSRRSMASLTVDPLDGTKAFGRRQSGGFGPMLSLCTRMLSSPHSWATP